MSKTNYYTYVGNHPELQGLTLSVKEWAKKVNVSYSCIYSRLSSEPNFWAWVEEALALSILDSTCGYKHCDNQTNSIKVFCSRACKVAEYKRLRTEGAKKKICRYSKCSSEFSWDPTKGPQYYCTPQCCRADAANHANSHGRGGRSGTRNHYRSKDTRPEACKTCAKYTDCLSKVAFTEGAPWPIDAGEECYQAQEAVDISSVYGRLKSGGVIPASTHQTWRT